LAVLGIPVKSILVPDVEATAVLEINGYSVPVAVEKLVPVTAALNVVAPVTVPPVSGKAPVMEVRLNTSMTTVSPAVHGLASVTVVPFVAV
jgi:predicted transcriptional regulator